VKKISFTEERIKKNVHSSLLEEYLGVIEEYQSIQDSHKTEMRRIMKSQKNIVESSAVYTDETGEKALSRLDNIFIKSANSKYSEIIILEEQLKSVQDLFVDMAILVKEQSEMIDRIAYQVANAKEDIKEATKVLIITDKHKNRPCMVQ